MSTITSEFTKEQLIAAACSRIDFARQMLRGNPLPLAKRKWEIELSISEIALASLDALKSKDDFGGEVVPVYTAPPAPSVDEDLLHMAASAIDDLLSNKDRPGAGVWADIPAKLRRAAMLQGADGNSPVIPDGWVPCSERMPSVGEKVLAYRPDAPESNDPLIKMAKYVGKSAHGHGFDCYCKPSHWMLLPSAPQQEVKNG